jgi:hypothetical protein
MARPFLAPFCRLLRLAGSRWRYSTPPPHGFGQESVRIREVLLPSNSIDVLHGFPPHLEPILTLYPNSHVALHASHALPTLRSEFLPNALKKCPVLVLVLILLWDLQIVCVGGTPKAADINMVQIPNIESPRSAGHEASHYAVLCNLSVC